MSWLMRCTTGRKTDVRLHQRVQSAVGRSAQLRAVATLNVECATSEDTDVDRLLQLAASHGRGFGAGPGGAPLSIAQVPAASTIENVYEGLPHVRPPRLHFLQWAA